MAVASKRNLKDRLSLAPNNLIDDSLTLRMATSIPTVH